MTANQPYIFSGAYNVWNTRRSVLRPVAQQAPPLPSTAQRVRYAKLVGAGRFQTSGLALIDAGTV